MHLLSLLCVATRSYLGSIFGTLYLVNTGDQHPKIKNRTGTLIFLPVVGVRAIRLPEELCSIFSAITSCMQEVTSRYMIRLQVQ